MRKCIVCGKGVDEVNSWVHCPQYGILICMQHCFDKCEYLENSTSITSCVYRNRKNYKN